MYNPRSGDGRITGSAASLLGLETALETGDPERIRTSIDKIILLHAIILSIGGIPLIYAGDEIATLNDYSYLGDPLKGRTAGGQTGRSKIGTRCPRLMLGIPRLRKFSRA